MAKKSKSVHVGGQQLPLLVPTSSWSAPAELPDLRGRVTEIALDRETKDLGLISGRGPGWAYFGSRFGGQIIGTSAAWREGKVLRSFYAPVAHPDSDCFDIDQIRRWELDHQKAGVRFIMQNAPYDVGWGDAEMGVPCPEKVDDTTCMAYMIDENRLSYNLDALCEWRGLPGKDTALIREAAQAFGYADNDSMMMENMWRLPARYVGIYAETDAVRTLQLAENLRPEIAKQEVGEAYQLEMDLLPMVHAMRKRGIRIDLEYAEKAKEHFKKISAQAFADLSNHLGQTVGIDEARSNGWLTKAFDEAKVKYPKDNDGRGSFEKKWMERVDHWLPQLLVRGKAYEDAAEKFVQGFILDFAHRGRLHASINQFKSEEGGTRTYRFSYSDPPLQQMPNRDEGLASLIRGCFLPEEGELWFAADYSQQEYRLIVHYAEVLRLTKATLAGDKYRNDPKTDFHSMVAEMTGLDRKSAKDSNFAKSYGAGIPKFAAMIRASEERAAEIMEQYDRELPFNKELNGKLQKLAEMRGYIKLLDGARIHWDMWEPAWLSREERARGWGSGSKYKMGYCSREEAETRVADKDHPWYGKRLRRANCRKAMNACIQGGAARQTKMAMRACHREGYLPLLQMHDELDFSLRHEREGARVQEIMRDVRKLTVPMMVDGEWGVNWGHARAIKAGPGKAAYDASWRAAWLAAGGGKPLRTARAGRAAGRATGQGLAGQGLPAGR